VPFTKILHIGHLLLKFAWFEPFLADSASDNETREKQKTIANVTVTAILLVDCILTSPDLF
jgi:hypothetical protein